MYESKRDLVVVAMSLLILVFLTWGVKQISLNQWFYSCGNESDSKIQTQDRVAPIFIDSTQLQWDAGKQLFKANCQSCHLPDKKMTGPALNDIIPNYTALELYEYLKRDKTIEQRASENAYCLTYSYFSLEDVENLRAYIIEYPKFLVLPKVVVMQQ